MEKYNKKYTEQHRTKINEYNKKWRESHIEKCRLSSINYYHKIQLQVFIHYGGSPPRCTCCGESKIKFLTIDHINNDGYKNKMRVGDKLYRWLVKNNYPEGFQVLCHNCNQGKARNKGVCPHLEDIVEGDKFERRFIS